MIDATAEPVPYHATAVRPGYDELPRAVRDQIARWMGGEPVSAAVAGGGFSGGFAATLAADSGKRLFVKAAPPDLPVVVRAYSAEAHVNPALPPGVPAPALRFSAQIDEWVVIAFDAVDGKAPRLPISDDEWTRMLDAWAWAAEALTPAPASLRDLGLRTFAEDAGDAFTGFAKVAAGEIAPPPMPESALRHVDTLAELEAAVYRAVSADSVMHGDLRPDNMIVGADRAWICDWNFPCLGAPWFDTVPLLVVAQGEGRDADALFWRHPTSAGVTDEQLDSVLATVCGYYLTNAVLPPIPRVSPHIRAHQRWSGLATLDWLTRRQGW